ncbi:MAG: hypothetical protein DRG83_02825 [Deltaproteobacteria bacterium]|nr:MAG: hypothetical protein DRG83_02825 [Deltaproteobacteria bacterium]
MSKMSKKHEKAKRYEQTKAKAHRGKHLGGPGKPDYERGNVKGEVKNWNKPLDSGTLRKLYQKGIREVENKGGFTSPAIELAKQKGIKLFQRGMKIT